MKREKHRKKEGFNPQIITVDEMPDHPYKIILHSKPQ